MTWVEQVEVCSSRALEAFIRLGLQNDGSNQRFQERFRRYAHVNEVESVPACLRGLSTSSVKNMRRSGVGPRRLSMPMVGFIFFETDIDVTPTQSLQSFYELGFDAQLGLDVVTRNSEDDEVDVHDLRNFRFEIYEANAKADDPGNVDLELDLRIGFDRIRLSLRAENLRPVGNYLAAETPRDPDGGGEPDYTGWFLMRLASRDPISWVFDPKTEGSVLHGRVDADELGRVESSRGAAIVAELTARRDALRVRVIAEDGGKKASKSLTEEHRDKMCAALARKSFAATADEFLLFRKRITPTDD